MVAGLLSAIMTTAHSYWYLLGLAIHLCGLGCCYQAYLVWSKWKKSENPLTLNSSAIQQNGNALEPPKSQLALKVGRLALRAVLVFLLCAIVWFAVSDITETTEMYFRGRVTDATVIGRDIVGANAKTDSIHYAYRIGHEPEIVDHFNSPHTFERKYWTGYPLKVTYLPGSPRVHRLGTVDTLALVQRLLFWLLLSFNGCALLGIPLSIIDDRLKLDPNVSPLSK